MKVFIMRHGEAAMHAPSDAERPLTENGKLISHQSAEWLKSAIIKIEKTAIERVLVSPYLRAQQTLHVVQQVIETQQINVLAELTPAGNETLVADYLHILQQQEVSSVLIVSHLPLVGYLVSELCPNEAPPMFMTSSIVSIDLQVENGEIDEIYMP